MPDALWRLRLLGAVQAHDLQGRPLSLSSRPAARLLARLALWPRRSHPREELIELLWPGVELPTGRNRLRQLLSTLRLMLEVDGQPVIEAGRWELRLLAGRVQTDVEAFEASLPGNLAQARALYMGELMPGYYDDWIVEERRRLAALRERLDAPASPAGGPVPTGDALVRAAGDELPSYWTPAFGLAPRVEQLAQLVQTHRLVTVHGAGGAGKTRLAAAVAQGLRDGTLASLRPGAYVSAEAPQARPPSFDRQLFVPMIDCRQPDQLMAAVAQALRASGGATPMASIAAALAGRRVLLIADNLEQLSPEADAQLERLLLANPGLHLLNTSRRLLGLAGEVSFELEGLSAPTQAEGRRAAAEVAAHPAVALLVDRARGVHRGFELTEDNAAALAGLARLLGGMPLALELAASRLRNLAPQELLERLAAQAGSPMLDLLARRADAAPGATSSHRHASMRDVIAWSWSQIGPRSAAFLGALSVFSAPASAELVAAVTRRPLSEVSVLLAQLHDASLLVSQPALRGRTRHVLLQPVREYAAEQTLAETAAAARARLRQWLIEWAEAQASPTSSVAAPAAGSASHAWAELAPHVHASIQSAVVDGQPEQALRLAVALRARWDTEAPPLPDIQALEAALEQLRGAEPVGARATANAPPARTLARACELLAFGRMLAGFPTQALAHAEQALALADDPSSRSLALARWATTQYQCGRLDLDFESPVGEAIALAREAGDIVAWASALRVLSVIRCNLQLDFAGSERLVAEAQSLWEQVGNQAMVRMCLLGRAVLWAGLGRAEEGLTVHAHCEQEAQAQGDWQGCLHIARQIGRMELRAHRWPAAVAAFGRSLDLGWRHSHAMGVVHALLHLPDALALLGQTEQSERAARLIAFAAATWQRLYGPLNPIEAFELERTQRLLRRSLGAAALERWRLQGLSMDLAEAVAQGLDAVRACAADPGSAPARRPLGPTGWRALRRPARSA